jgi:hypothetical protein
MAEADRFYTAAERRIEYFAIGLGAAGAIIAGVLWGVRAGLGFSAGAVLSWINFRWMKQGVGTLSRLAKAQEGAEKVHVGPGVYFKFIGRYALLFAGAYVILSYFRLSIISLLAGFAVIFVAALAEVVGQLFQGRKIPHADS